MPQLTLFACRMYEGSSGKGAAGGCFSDHATKASGDASAGCAWCTSAAVPPACNTLADARKLPPSVFKCDKLAARAK